MMKKCLAIGFILLLMGTSIISGIAQFTEKQSPSRGTWLYVGGSGPGNYTRIQDAIDNASKGDTVFVYDDSSPYYEYVRINKSIHLVGENQKTTVIDGQWSFLSVVTLSVDEITFTGFTIQNLYHGLSGLYVRSNDNAIIGNIFSNNSISNIYLMNSNNNLITENTFSYSDVGICLSGSNDTTITRNNITKNSFYGIGLFNSRRNIISMNNVMDNGLSNAYFIRTFGIFPLSNHWDANYWGRPYFFPNRIPGELILLEKPEIILPLVGNFDWHPAQEPYDITGMR